LVKGKPIAIELPPCGVQGSDPLWIYRRQPCIVIT